MFTIAICDDEAREIDRSNNLLTQYGSEHPEYQISTYSFRTPLDLLAYLETNTRFDILLLDVYMPGMLGTKAAQELRAMGDTCEIIFLTSSRDHAVDAFSLDAIHYLVKPYSEKEFFVAMDKAFDHLSKKNGTSITVKSTEGVIRINLNKLVYSETNNHLQHLHLSDGRIIYIRMSSFDFYELVKETLCFYKCGSTYVFNMDYIVELSSKTVSISNDTKIPMLSRNYAEFKTFYMDYYCKS